MGKRVLIIGGGSGGIPVAAKLKRELPSSDEITIIDPAAYHYYQPMWTLVGAGWTEFEKTQKPMAEVIPKGVSWIKEKVTEVKPTQNKVVLASGQELSYDVLVVANGLELNWKAIDGLEGHLGKDGIYSIYDKDTVALTFEKLNEMREGEAIFTMPPVPIKCAGAPQKIMYLAEDYFSKRGFRNKINVHFYTFGKAMFGIPVFAQALAKVVQSRKIQPHFLHKLVAVKPEQKIAVFKLMKEVDVEGCGSKPGAVPELVEAETVEVKYDFLHVVPPMKASAWLTQSGLANTEGPQKGWLEVDQYTLQHKKFSNIFGIGDVTGVPNSKTGAAIRKMYPVVVKNLVSFSQGKELTAKYDGYSSCPLITKPGRVILAEFGYDSKLMPSFPLDPAVERFSMWIVKAYLLPIAYWKAMMKGRF